MIDKIKKTLRKHSQELKSNHMYFLISKDYYIHCENGQYQVTDKGKVYLRKKALNLSKNRK